MANDNEASYDLFSNELSEISVNISNLLGVASQLQSEVSLLLALSATRLYANMRDGEGIPLEALVALQTIRQETDRLGEKMASLSFKLDRAFQDAKNEAMKRNLPVRFAQMNGKSEAKPKLQD